MAPKLRYGFEFECSSKFAHKELNSILKKSCVADLRWSKPNAKYRAKDHGYVVSDVSIAPERWNDYRVEIVTPVITNVIAAESVLRDICKVMSALTLETNSTTGLHISMSFSSATLMQQVNLLKLWYALDNYVILSCWGRENNKFCRNFGGHEGLSALHNVLTYHNCILNWAHLSKMFSQEHEKWSLFQSNNNLGYWGKCFAINVMHFPKRIEFRHIGNTDYHIQVDHIVECFHEFRDAMVVSVSPWKSVECLIVDNLEQAMHNASLDTDCLDNIKMAARKTTKSA